MPKMKTKSSAAKRFKKTATGKLKRNKAFTSQRKRNLRKSTLVDKTSEKTMKKIMPYL